MTNIPLTFTSLKPQNIIYSHTGKVLNLTITLLDQYSDFTIILYNDDYPEFFKLTYTGLKGTLQNSVDLIPGKYTIEITPQNIPAKTNISVNSIA